ncbi:MULTISPECIES: low molecular weight phosphatase family protein [Sphingobacterium]|jgi:arsenate reductase|uniref:arsenate-mycothiol transferase ArsC n=1 Tax=Sphingobacterium TaxID=28453 RepID=UPI00104DAFD6|nr:MULTISPECIES: protein-tyrosine-phosphatase [Sphingobacterium]MCW2259543.1 arsenate reductase [Sphingobacterium kitahiroshimense]TCR14011.1 arsenate reductase [Sphingobacterium sp. JUb78]
MNAKLVKTISEILKLTINQGRKSTLQPLIDYIQDKVTAGSAININFICTHNSRRSHLSQVWAQIAAAHYQIPNVTCYSGGTEETALFPKIAATLENAGLEVTIISETLNPVYAFKYDKNALPMIGFSKKYDSPFNPESNFAAVMTCSQADGGCPFIPGAEKRIPITFEDPKIADHTAQEDEIYQNRSVEIASEMFYVFSQIK